MDKEQDTAAAANARAGAMLTFMATELARVVAYLMASTFAYRSDEERAVDF